MIDIRYNVTRIGNSENLTLDELDVVKGKFLKKQWFITLEEFS